MRRQERIEQIALFTWIKAHQSAHPILSVIHHVPNGERRDARTGALLKAMGVRAGVWDICCPSPTGEVMWIEMKADRGKLSPEQIQFRDLLNGAHYFAVCKTWYEAAAYIIDHYDLEDLGVDKP